MKYETVSAAQAIMRTVEHYGGVVQYTQIVTSLAPVFGIAELTAALDYLISQHELDVDVNKSIINPDILRQRTVNADKHKTDLRFFVV